MEKTPNFESIKTEKITLPGSEYEKVHTSFNDPILEGYSATVLLDSVEPNAQDDSSRLTTIITRFPRCVLAEVNTHRVFSRNSASSRARSMKVTIAELMEDPYIPLFTKNQKGMGGRYLSESERERAVSEWLKARDLAVLSVLRMLLEGVDSEIVGKDVSLLKPEEVQENWSALLDVYSDLYQDENEDMLSPHKQNVNRLLEPFMWHEAIITADTWDNFFDLRDHDDAQPEIRAIARLIKVALEESTPVEAVFHTPFEDGFYYDNNNIHDQNSAGYELSGAGLDAFLAKYNDVFMSSAGDCARVSYKSKLEQGATNSQKLGYRLLEAGHLSPFEHVAISTEFLQRVIGVKNIGNDNFSDTWTQFRTLLADKGKNND